jgi:hypothetical protein
MKNQIAQYELDLNNPHPLTKQQRAEIDALKSMSDNAIDYSDIPPLSDEFWKDAMLHKLGKSTG